VSVASYVLRRLITALPVLVGVTAITFLLMMLTIGNYVPGLELNGNVRPEDIQRLRESMGLDRPIYVQYALWFLGLLHGDFGRSLVDGTPVLKDILERLPNTLELTATAIIIGVVLAIPLGAFAALRRGSAVDNALTTVSVAGFAIPQFWLGLVVILLFSVSFEGWGLPWLPAGGALSPVGGGDFVDRLTHLVLPASVLAFLYLSIWSRYTRSSMIEVLNQDYVRTARAKGMSERRVIFGHALRNALLPLVTLIGLELPGLVSGSLVVEVVFSWPGIGRLAYDRALQYDYTTVLGITIFVTMLVILGNLTADLLYGVLDPRIRHR
jgi:peptide/nickel transport system permease protein